MQIDSQAQILLNYLAQLVNQGELTQQQIATATAIDQSQISRILSGRIKRLSANVKRLCEYAQSLPEPQVNRLNHREMITNAALDLWDGSNEHANSLFRLFNAIKSLQNVERGSSK